MLSKSEKLVNRLADFSGVAEFINARLGADYEDQLMPSRNNCTNICVYLYNYLIFNLLYLISILSYGCEA